MSRGKSLLGVADRGFSCGDCGLTDGQRMIFIGGARQPPIPIPANWHIGTPHTTEFKAAGTSAADDGIVSAAAGPSAGPRPPTNDPPPHIAQMQRQAYAEELRRRTDEGLDDQRADLKRKWDGGAENGVESENSFGLS